MTDLSYHRLLLDLQLYPVLLRGLQSLNQLTERGMSMISGAIMSAHRKYPKRREPSSHTANSQVFNGYIPLALLPVVDYGLDQFRP